MRVFAATKAATTALRFSHSGRFAVMGAADGMVRITPLRQRHVFEDSRHWEACVHDGQQGSVSGVDLSFDDHFILSAARDMTLFVQVML